MILKPKPEVMDPLVEKGQDVDLSVRIVSGDNVEIRKIEERSIVRSPT